MSRENLNRRNFIKGVIGGGLKGSFGLVCLSGLANSSCAIFDNYLIGDPYRIDNGVLIIGAGLSGLTAAYTLKKNKIPFRVLEASSRIGGRIYTLNHFNSDGQIIELGAEFFQSKDQAIFNLCRELQLLTDEINIRPEERITLMSGQKLSKAELKKNNDSFKRAFAKVYANQKEEDLDRLSLSELLNAFRDELDPNFIKLIELAAINRYGVESNQMSALMFIKSSEKDEANTNKIYRVHGGNQELIRALYYRVNGVIPDLQVQVNSPVVAVKRKNTGFETTIKSGVSTKTFFSNKIIFAIPINQLKYIEGIDQLGIQPEVLEAYKNIKMGSHTKLSLGFNFRSPQEKFSVFGDVYFQNTWLTHRGQEGRSSIVTALVGGDHAKLLGPHDVDKFTNFINDHQELHLNENQVRYNIKTWHQVRGIEGSFAYYQPGQYLPYQKKFAEGVSSDGVYFAGDYMHGPSLMGMNSAIESGIAAAEKIISKT